MKSITDTQKNQQIPASLFGFSQASAPQKKIKKRKRGKMKKKQINQTPNGFC
jgi:hypothetical protein